MGQYYVICNLDKREFLKPHHMGDGAKLLEFGQGFTMQGLAVLLATSNGMGGGDLHQATSRWDYQGKPENPEAIAGRWAGDRIAVVGDYDEFSPFAGLYQETGEDITDWRDISWAVIDALRLDGYLAEEIKKDTWYAGIEKRSRPANA